MSKLNAVELGWVVLAVVLMLLALLGRSIVRHSGARKRRPWLGAGISSLGLGQQQHHGAGQSTHHSDGAGHTGFGGGHGDGGGGGLGGAPH